MLTIPSALSSKPSSLNSVILLLDEGEEEEEVVSIPHKETARVFSPWWLMMPSGTGKLVWGPRLLAIVGWWGGGLVWELRCGKEEGGAHHISRIGSR